MTPRNLMPEQILSVERAGIPVISLDDSGSSRLIRWLVALEVEGDAPLPREIEQLRSYVEFRLAMYRPSYQEQIRARGKDRAGVTGNGPLLWEGSTVSHWFQKGSRWLEDTRPGWQYRRATWAHGYVPFRAESGWEPLTLVQAMDRLNGFREKDGTWTILQPWSDWKSKHPDLFEVSVLG